jgi:hypothetical protein
MFSLPRAYGRAKAANNDESVLSVIRILRRSFFRKHWHGFAAPPPESEYQKQNLRHCCSGKPPPTVSLSSTGQETLIGVPCVSRSDEAPLFAPFTLGELQLRSRVVS